MRKYLAAIQRITEVRLRRSRLPVSFYLLGRVTHIAEA